MAAHASSPPPSPRRITRAIARAAVPGVVVLLVWWQLMGGSFHWSCPIRVVTHHPCPTCGFSSAARELWHLHFAAATHLNPLACIVLPFVAALCAGELAGFVVTGDFGWLTQRRWVRALGLALCAALFVVWVARFFGAFGGPLAV